MNILIIILLIPVFVDACLSLAQRRRNAKAASAIKSIPEQ